MRMSVNENALHHLESASNGIKRGLLLRRGKKIMMLICVAMNKTENHLQSNAISIELTLDRSKN